MNDKKNHVLIAEDEKMIFPMGEWTTALEKHEAETKKARTSCGAMPKEKVLVVDDMIMHLYLAQGMLSPYGLHIDTATSGFEAIEKIKRNAYNLVLINHIMPGMDGVETTREIRKMEGEYGKLPIVALAVNAAAGMKEMFLASGFNGFMSKPIVMQEMDAILKEWLYPDKTAQSAGADAEGIDSYTYNRFVDGIKKIDEIDAEIGFKRFSSVKKTYYKAVNMFSKNLPRECKKLAAFLDGRDIDGFTISILGMRSSLATIGAMDLTITALELETASKNHDIGRCLELFPEFTEKLLSLRERLSAILPKADALAEKEPADTEWSRESAEEAEGIASTMHGSTQANERKTLTAA